MLKQAVHNKGLVLILTFIITIAILVVVLAFLYLTSTRMTSAGADVSSQKALWIAEAGIQQVLYEIKTDTAYAASPTTVTGNIGGGSYSVTCTKNADTYTMTSTGTFGVINRKIQQTAIGASSPECYDYVIYAGNNYVTSGAINLVVNGLVKNFAPSGNYPTVTLNQGVNDWYWNNTPVAQRKTSNYSFTAGTYSGLWYIKGTATIQSNVTINGTIVATSNINRQNNSTNNITINPSAPYPALVTNNNINLNRVKRLTITNGVVYAGVDGSGSCDFTRTGDVAPNPTANITAVILDRQTIDFSLSNNVTVNHDSAVKNNLPPGFSVPGGGVATVTPQKDWNEIVPAL